MKKCIIVGAGDFSENKIKIQEEDLIIAADGGLSSIINIGIIPNIVIGDMDSCLNIDEIMESIKSKGADVEFIKLPCEKDDTDMLAAIKIGFERGYSFFNIYGGLGKRLDHSIANIQCLDYIINLGGRGVIIDKNVSVMLINNEMVTFDETNKGRISCFSFGADAKGVTEKGLKYEVENVTLTTAFPIGVSNEFIGKKSSISVEDGKLLIYKELL